MLSDNQRDQLLAYVEGRLPPKDTQEIEHLIQTDADCRAEYRILREMHEASINWEQQQVPEWNRTRYIAPPPVNRFQWLQWSSLTASLIAVTMVVLQINVQVADQGFYIGFGQPLPAQSQAVETPELEQRFKEWQYAQTQYIDDRFEDLQLQQASTSGQLFQTLLSFSRDERHREMTQMMKYWQQQRVSDLQKVSQMYQRGMIPDYPDRNILPDGDAFLDQPADYLNTSEYPLGE